ncbi:MAG: FAD-dependent oxidoreductase [Candidatus Altiarchaeota archaeon]|nr:FAD-dependent oxidoreductase [Candidatus Altiarchaeota archaeon]
MDYDLIIIGGGPAGLTAGIYAARRKLKTLVVERGLCGGQMQIAHELGNWPGVESVNGQKLAGDMEEHARGVGVEFLMDEVVDLDLKGNVKRVRTRDKTLECSAVILATGGQHKKLNVAGEESFVGRGVSYCATCDGPFFKDKVIAVIGGGNSAVEEALYMTDVASKVYLLHSEGRLSAEEVIQDKLKNSPVELMLDTTVEEICGTDFVEKIVLNSSGKRRGLPVQGVFISIGQVPSIQTAKKAGIKLDEKGFVTVDKSMKTNLPGVYAAGDVTGEIPQVVIASGSGAIAALEAYKHVKSV